MEDRIILFLTITGILLLFVSMYRVSKIRGILRDNVYDARLWLVIILMLIGFIAGYTLLVLNQFSDFVFPISLELVVAIVYFGGSIFTIITTGTVESNLINILGRQITDDEAITRFLTFADLPDSFEHKLVRNYSILCEHCEQNIEYSIPDIVRSNVVALDRGVSVESIFGTKSYILRPSHRCVDGRREYTVVHDKDLELRSIEGSRIIFGGKF